MTPPTRLDLIHRPTPLWRHPALDALVGCEVWVKRDDISEGAAAGNKARKLEYLLADARQRKAQVVITCGGLQSNHARATAILARQLGMRALLLLRTSDAPPAVPTGNLLLDRLVDAEVRLITPAQYRERTRLMQEAADACQAHGERAYVIPEGGSNGLGALGYVDAMQEVRAQLDAASEPGFDAVVHACGSGGTAAGVAWGCGRYGVAPAVYPMAVCDDSSYFSSLVASIMEQARQLRPELTAPARVEVLDHGKGPAYGVASAEQLELIVHVARASGLILDPVYGGKAMYALAHWPVSELPKPARVLFIHTGGLPGLLAQAAALAPWLEPSAACR